MRNAFHTSDFWDWRTTTNFQNCTISNWSLLLKSLSKDTNDTYYTKCYFDVSCIKCYFDVSCIVLSAILMFQYFVFVILGFFLRVSYVFLCSVTGLQVLENLLSKKKNLLFNILLILKLQWVSFQQLSHCMMNDLWLCQKRKYWISLKKWW